MRSVPFYASAQQLEARPSVAIVRAPIDGPRAIWLTWMCVNPHCRTWTSNGAHRTGHCDVCGTPRGAY